MHVNKSNSNALTLLCSPQYLFVCHISAQPDTRLQIHSVTKITLNHLELEHLTVFNPTRIAQEINTIRTKNNLTTAPLFIGLYGPAVKDECINLPSAHPRLDQLPISYAPHWQWNYCYLYPYDHSYYFYVCGIPRELLLQFKLLSLTHNWNLRYLTSERMALLQLYRHLFGNAFRPSQLGIHMQQKNNNIDSLFSRDDLARIAHIPSQMETNIVDTGSLLASCGLFIAGTPYA